MNTNSVVRDPRLELRRHPQNVGLSQHEVAQQRPPPGPRAQSAPDIQRDLPGGTFIRSIAQFVEVAVKARTKEAEKERIQKKRAETIELLDKAKSQRGFPSFVECYQTAKDVEDAALESVNVEIKGYQSRLQELEVGLINQWAESANSKSSQFDDRVQQSESRVRQLEQNLKAANDKIAALHGDIAQFNNYHKSMEHGLEEIQKKQNLQQKSFGGFTNSLGSLESKTDNIAKQLKAIEEKPPVQPVNGITPDTKKLLDDLSTQHKNLEQRTAECSHSLESLSSFYQKTSNSTDLVQKDQQLQMNQFKQTLMDQQQKLDLVTQLQTDQQNKLEIFTSTQAKQEQKLEKLEKLDRLSNGQTASSKPDDAVVQVLKKEAERLADQVKEIGRINGELVWAEIEDFKKEIVEKLSESQQAQQLLTENIQDLMLKVPRERLDPKVDGLFEAVRRISTDMEPFKTALLSLESRYNNLTTEPIVQHMVRAMHEMYPSVDQILKELTLQKQTLGSLEQNLPSLEEKVKQLETQGKHTALPQDELNSIKAQQQDLKGSIGNLVERYQWLNQEEFRGMQSRLESLAEKQSNTDRDLLQKKTADQEKFQDIERQGTSLKDEMTSLKDELASLNGQIQKISDNLERLDEDYNRVKESFIEGDMQSLQLRMTQIEQCSKKTYENTKIQLDRIKSEMELLRPDSPTDQLRPAPRPDLLSNDRSQGMRIKRRHSNSDDDGSQPPSTSSTPLAHGPLSSRTSLSKEERIEKKKRKKNKKRIITAHEAMKSQEAITIDDD
ncbi:uncharacterized protein DSM5745_08272 [Aspergillus mulundensis]|uniref:Paramyosin n=1 Tax=Aspergillus mulundensis TaxID=1810919 RepID=A0A3D8RA47_9EURO|nr:hypothetical protein DSM5745_08272 [Aspergillus mulundensis]RDW70761.1 hypothetical protein DSM5745_08272 [Aspergillus mulundensis]